MRLEIIFWIVALVVFLIFEGVTAALVSIWFVLGAIAAVIAAAVGAPLWLQITLFLLVSGVALLLTRPLVKKYVAGKKVSTNADRNIGQEGVVIGRIDNLNAMGLVKVKGADWTARSVDDRPIEEGTIVRVCRIEGAKLIVETANILEPEGEPVNA